MSYDRLRRGRTDEQIRGCAAEQIFRHRVVVIEEFNRFCPYFSLLFKFSYFVAWNELHKIRISAQSHVVLSSLIA